MNAYTGAGLIGSGLEATLSNIGNIIAKQQMFDAYRQELAKQAQYAQMAQGPMQQRIAEAGVGTAQQQMQQGYGQRLADYGKATATPMDTQGLKVPGLNARRNEAAVQLAGQQRAKLGSYGDWIQQQMLASSELQRQLNQATNFAGGWAQNVYPMQMYAAQHAGDPYQMAAAGLGMLGSGLNMYGLGQRLNRPGTPPRLSPMNTWAPEMYGPGMM